ncbi:TniQ family protein [Rhizobium sp. BK176]|uniref:TniQ family protein n=1 Tax=Rhizobium sp. BK176 TaxID=2587071 RepID=UPI0021687195|nr:TniQ family protein [Rhizobium sp. BK176]MCS4089648.1 hypothetical protein [Rhizobium sp. BK176]
MTPIRRPFTRWRLRPHQGEPSYSYFARLVADEGHNSVKIYATEIGVNGRNIVPEEMLDALRKLPLLPDEMERLRAATPILRDSVYQVGNERLKQKQLSFRHRRVCPHCLATARYHRIQWDVVSARYCSIHGVELVDKPRFGWWWPHFDVSPQGVRLIDPTEAVPARPLPFHEMLRTRLELGERGDGPLATTELSDIITVAQAVGQFAVIGKRSSKDKSCDIDAGYQVLTLSHGERVEWFKERYEALVPAAVRKRGFDASGGPLRAGFDVGGDALWDAVEQAQYEGFAKVGTLGRKFVRRDAIRSDKTLKEAAAALGLPPKGLSKFIQRIGLLPHAKWNGDAISLDTEAFEALKAVVDDLITLPQTIEITGIPGHEFRQVAKAGLVAEYPHMPTGGTFGPRYSRKEVTEIVERCRSSTSAKPSGELKTLISKAKQLNTTQGQLVSMVMRGEITPSLVDQDRLGFRGLYFE